MAKIILFYLALLALALFLDVDKSHGADRYHANFPSEVCMEWALGENWNTMPQQEIDNEWNNRHKDIFVIKGSDYMVESINRIGEACKDQGIDE